MNNDIKFPIMDLTESTFQEEKVFFSDMEWDSELILNKKQIERLPDRIYIDSEGKILKVKIGKIEKINSIMSFLSSPKYKVDLLLINTGELFQMEDLKREILLKRNQMFHI